MSHSTYKNLLIFLIIGLLSQKVISQVKVGNNPTIFQNSAIFEIESTTKGFLPPRMTTSQRNAIVNPSAGLYIFNLTTNCYDLFNGIAWINQCEYFQLNTGNSSSGGTSNVTSWSSSIGCSIGAGSNNSPTGIKQGAVNETMVLGVTAPSTASVTLIANVEKIGTYQITTNTVSGITFIASGTFSSIGNQTITLLPIGTPTNAGNFVWTTTTTPSINIFGSVLTSSAPLGSSYTAHFNGIVGGVHIGTTWQLSTQTTGETFNNNSLCANKPISAQGCDGITSVFVRRTYNTISINGQCWLQSNLKDEPVYYSNYNSSSWTTNNSTGDQGYWGFYNITNTNGSAGWDIFDLNNIEGILYQWCGAMNGNISERSRGICPAGWHVPSDCEWMYLEHGQGMIISDQILNSNFRSNSNDNQGTPGYKLRSQGLGQTNVSGFSALLTGIRLTNATFNFRNTVGQFWTSTAFNNDAYIRSLESNERGVFRSNILKSNALSVRCLKD